MNVTLIAGSVRYRDLLAWLRRLQNPNEGGQGCLVSLLKDLLFISLFIIYLKFPFAENAANALPGALDGF